jgi:hypothetical protein
MTEACLLDMPAFRFAPRSSERNVGFRFKCSNLLSHREAREQVSAAAAA